MSFFFGGGGKKVKPQYTGLATQTSTSNLPVTLAFGKCRLAPNIIWQGDFKAHKQKQKSGKGFGGSVTSYTYSASFQLALCYGPATNITKVWKDQSKETDYTELGFTVQLGSVPQAPWGYMTSNHPSEALGYSGIVVVSVANYDLGSANSLQQHSFEVQALLYNTQVDGTGDADPAQIISSFLGNVRYGVPMDTSIISNLMSTGAAPTTGDNAYQTYCRAMGFGLSPALISQEQAATIIDRWAKITNTAPVWTGYSLKFIPYGDEEVTAHGVKYLPDMPVRYELSDHDFLREEDADPITFDRIDPADAYNSITLTIKNRQNEYNDLPIEWRDQGLVDQFGIRPAQGMNAYDICEPGIGNKMAALVGQRIAYVRNDFNFKLSSKYCLLEPMDIVQCTDVRLGTFTCRIKDITEQDDDTLQIVAEEYENGVSALGISQAATTGNDPINTGAAAGPVNPPIIFQPPPSLTAGLPQIWAAVSGGNGTTVDLLWGGCEVWLSTDGGTAYNMVGTIDSPARMGKLTAGIPAYGGANPDITNTLSISSAMSDAEFSDATVSDAAAAVTLCYIKAVGANAEEYFSYTDTTLTGADAYAFDDLYRGLYGTTAGAHATNDPFARLDPELIFKYDFPLDLIGDTIYIKFVSFNIWGGGLQDISLVTAYTIVLSGAYTYGDTLAELGDVDVSGATDGTVLVSDGMGGYLFESQPYGFAFGPKTPVVSKILAAFDSPIAWIIPASLTNSQGTIVDSDTNTATAPSAQTDFDIQSPPGSSIGTMRFAASSLTATFINAAQDSVPIGTIVQVVAPANLNGITGAIIGSIKGTR